MRHYFYLLKGLITKNHPIYVHFGITHRCNLQCRMCSIWKTADKEKELSLEGIEEIAELLKRLGVVSVSLGGGEPFLREDILEVIKIFLSRKFILRVLTNGVLSAEGLVREAVACGLQHISISLDSLDPQKQDYICQMKGAHEKMMKNMSLLSEIIPKRGRLLLVNTVVSRLNIEELPELASWAQGLGFYISFLPIDTSLEKSEEFELHETYFKAIDNSYNRLLKMKHRGGNIFNSSKFLVASRVYLKTGKATWRCDAGRLYFSISPQGRFSICHNFDGEDVLSLEMFTHWVKSIEFREGRKDLIKGCMGCLRPCWAEVSYFSREPRSLYEMLLVHKSSLMGK